MRLKSRLVLVGLLLVAALTVGCTGGGGSSATNEAQIHRVLDKYEKAMVNADAEGLAGLFTYPLVLDGEEISSKEQAVLMYTFLFGLMEFKSMEVKDREIVVDSAGTTATASGNAHAEYVTFLGSDKDVQPMLFTLIKVGGQWKISGD